LNNFLIEIQLTKTIADLKDAIKIKKAHALAGVDADQIQLFKVHIPIKDAMAKLGGEELVPADDVSDHWARQPRLSDDHAKYVHIMVRYSDGFADHRPSKKLRLQPKAREVVAGPSSMMEPGENSEEDVGEELVAYVKGKDKGKSAPEPREPKDVPKNAKKVHPACLRCARVTMPYVCYILPGASRCIKCITSHQACSLRSGEPSKKRPRVVKDSELPGDVQSLQDPGSSSSQLTRPLQAPVTGSRSRQDPVPSQSTAGPLQPSRRVVRFHEDLRPLPLQPTARPFLKKAKSPPIRKPVKDIVAEARRVVSSSARREGLDRSIQKLRYRLEANAHELEDVLEAREITVKAIERLQKELVELGGNLSEDELVDDE
jgi:hypothetical protein